MLAVVLALSCINAQLTFWGPDGLSGAEYDNSLANFGGPTVFDVYGKINFANIEESCTDYEIEENSIVIITKTGSELTCYFSDVTLNVQQKGAKGAIYIVDNDIVMSPRDYE